MDEIMSVLAAFLTASYFYFWKVPIVVIAIALIVRGFIQVVKRGHSLQRFFVRSDFAVAFLGIPFYAICTLLPSTYVKSMANLIEVMILGILWGVVLFVRIPLSILLPTRYVFYARCGNALIFAMCVIFAYFFPTLPE